MLTAVTNSAAFVNFLLGVLPLPSSPMFQTKTRSENLLK